MSYEPWKPGVEADAELEAQPPLKGLTTVKFLPASRTLITILRTLTEFRFFPTPVIVLPPLAKENRQTATLRGFPYRVFKESSVKSHVVMVSCSQSQRPMEVQW